MIRSEERRRSSGGSCESFHHWKSNTSNAISRNEWSASRSSSAMHPCATLDASCSELRTERVRQITSQAVSSRRQLESGFENLELCFSVFHLPAHDEVPLTKTGYPVLQSAFGSGDGAQQVIPRHAFGDRERRHLHRAISYRGSTRCDLNSRAAHWITREEYAGSEQQKFSHSWRLTLSVFSESWLTGAPSQSTIRRIGLG